MKMIRIFAMAAMFGSTLGAMASDLEINGFYYKLDSLNNTAEVTYKGDCRCGGKTYTGNVVVPSQVKYGDRTFTVTNIGDYAFSNSRELNSVTIPESVTQVGTGAFEGCNKLKEVKFAGTSNVRTLGRLAFFACTELESITIPASVDSLGAFIFEFCTKLSNVDFEAGSQLRVISEYAFCRTALSQIIIPESATEIDKVAFCHNKNMTDLVLPNTVRNISVQNPFCYNTQLLTIRAEEGNPIFDSRENCNAIIQTATNTLVAGGKTTVIPTSVKALGRSSFNNCTDLDSIFVPASVDSIGKYAFYTCTGLKKFTFPSSMKVMADSTFWKATNLEEVISLTAKPFKIDESDFESVTYNTAVLKVAPGTKRQYQTAVGWRNFAQIEELDYFVSDGISYKVIENGKVEVIPALEGIAYAGNVVIPNKVTSGTNSYQVASIAEGALDGVALVSIPKGVKANVKNAKVVVRNSRSKSLNFEVDNIRIYGQKGYIVIEGTDEVANIYSTNGVLLQSTAKRSIAIEKGIYLVKIGDNDAAKVIVE